MKNTSSRPNNENKENAIRVCDVHQKSHHSLIMHFFRIYLIFFFLVSVFFFLFPFIPFMGSNILQKNYLFYSRLRYIMTHTTQFVITLGRNILNTNIKLLIMPIEHGHESDEIKLSRNWKKKKSNIIWYVIVLFVVHTFGNLKHYIHPFGEFAMTDLKICLNRN